MSIIFENEACLVKNKLAGECSQESDRGLFPVHRLDLPVTGCLLLAKNAKAAAFLGGAFARGEAEKRYWGIIEKPIKENLPAAAELVHFLGIDKKTNKSFAFVTEELALQRRFKKPQKAIMRYRSIGRGENYLFLEIDLVTGRHHQIRTQLAAVGLHIKGDLKYGARRSEKGGGIRLHAYSLNFPNPLNPAEKIHVTSTPVNMDSLWTAFAEAVETCTVNADKS